MSIEDSINKLEKAADVVLKLEYVDVRDRLEQLEGLKDKFYQLNQQLGEINSKLDDLVGQVRSIPKGS